MKKINLIVALAAATLVASAAQADDKYVSGGFEASGHVVTLTGWQHQTKTAHPAGVGAGGYGVLGKVNGAQAAKADRFGFFVDEAELDVAKSFGENIRLRADFSLAGAGNTVEQVYATANIPAGNGIEFLLGQFDAPIGFESNEIVDNSLASFTNLQRTGIRPNTLTGAKIYYAFSDAWDFHFYAADTLAGGVNGAKPVGHDMPSFGFRLGYNWGEEGTQSTLGFSSFMGTEGPGKSKYTFGGDVDLSWWVSDAFNVGGEFLFRRDPKDAIAKAANTMAGLLNLTYNFSDVWDGTFRYAYTKQFNPALVNVFVGGKGYSNEISLGGGYAVADDAKIMLEGRFDWVNTAGLKSYDYGAALALAYNF